MGLDYTTVVVIMIIDITDNGRADTADYNSRNYRFVIDNKIVAVYKIVVVLVKF